MLVKTSELSGIALDWAVVKCEGLIGIIYCPENDYMGFYDIEDVFTPWKPSTDWAQGGLIIEREGITVSSRHAWVDDADEHGEIKVYKQYGKTPLIAAMRCYVASKLGDEVEVPDNLI